MKKINMFILFPLIFISVNILALSNSIQNNYKQDSAKVFPGSPQEKTMQQTPDTANQSKPKMRTQPAHTDTTYMKPKKYDGERTAPVVPQDTLQPK